MHLDSRGAGLLPRRVEQGSQVDLREPGTREPRKEVGRVRGVPTLALYRLCPLWVPARGFVFCFIHLLSYQSINYRQLLRMTVGECNQPTAGPRLEEAGQSRGCEATMGRVCRLWGSPEPFQCPGFHHCPGSGTNSNRDCLRGGGSVPRLSLVWI